MPLSSFAWGVLEEAERLGGFELAVSALKVRCRAAGC
jgi:hypothetical protein